MDQPKLGKVSNEVKAELEKALRDRKDAVEDGIMQKQIEDDWIDVTLPGWVQSKGCLSCALYDGPRLLRSGGQYLGL